MIVGIFSLLGCCIPFIQFPLAMIAIVLAILSRKGQPFSGFAVVGLVLGILSILVSVLMTVYWGYLLSHPEFLDLYNEMMQMYE